MPKEELKHLAEDGPFDWELIERFDRLRTWMGEIRERDADPARKDDRPAALEWYAGKLQLTTQLEVQITIEQDFEFFPEEERKRRLREWFNEAAERIEYKKALLYLPETTIEMARAEILQIRESIDARAEEIATAISAVFGYTEHFEFWPCFSTGEKVQLVTPDPIVIPPPNPRKAPKRKVGDGGPFVREITMHILWLENHRQEVDYQNVARLIIVDKLDVRAVLPKSFRAQVRKTQFAGNLLDFIRAEEARNGPTDFRELFTKHFSIAKRRLEKSRGTTQ